MASINELPDHLLELILHHVGTSLRADGEGDTFHRAAAWASLARVGRRWRRIMQGEPVGLTLQYRDDRDWDAAMGQHIDRLEQLAHGTVPVASLAIRQPVDSPPYEHSLHHFNSLHDFKEHDLCYAVTQLLAADEFQRTSGPVLESLTIQQCRCGCFGFTARPQTYPRLKTLVGAGGRLPHGLPPQLETLHYTAFPAPDDCSEGPLMFRLKRLAAALTRILGLRNLKRLTVADYYGGVRMPISALTDLPASVQVATFTNCSLKLPEPGEILPVVVHEDEDEEEAEIRNTYDSLATAWWDAAPDHLQISEWDAGYERDNFWRDAAHVSFKLETKASLRASGKYVGPCRRGEQPM